jgi:RNA polymerase sigma factor (sigma-70 family)
MATAQLEAILRHIRKLAAGRCLPQLTDRQLLDDFCAHRDETAFAAMVGRHGPMVLRVCRRVLNHEQDAEDAFQATFLVLARNTRSIRKRNALSQWLHGVAYRTAMKAKRSAARRRNHEAKWWRRPQRKRQARRGMMCRPSWTRRSSVCPKHSEQPSCSASWRARADRKPPWSWASNPARYRVG